MDKFKVISLNIRGLYSPNKRAKLLIYLRRKAVDIALIQETHLKRADVQRLQNKFYRVAAFSTDNTKTKGTIVLISRRCNLKIDRESQDQSGRLAYVCTNIKEKKIAFVSIYAPTIFEANFFPQITNHLISLIDYSLIIGGDMNAVIDPVLDRSSLCNQVQLNSSAALNNFVKALNLIDVWRSGNPLSRDYTFFSTRHLSYSRIDYLLCSKELLISFDQTLILQAILADHNPIMADFNCNLFAERSQRWRFNISLLLNNQFDADFKAGLSEFLSFNIGSVEDPIFVWEATKGFIKDFSISFATNLKKMQNQRIDYLEKECQSLERSLKSAFSNSVFKTLQILKAELNDLLRRKAEFVLHRTRQNYYFSGARPSKLLALKLKQSQASVH